MPRPYRPFYDLREPDPDRPGKSRYKLGPDGKRVRRQALTWYVKVRKPEGGWREQPLSKDFMTACRLAARLTGDADRRRGLPVLDPDKAPLKEQLEDWRVSMVADGCLERHAETQAVRVRRVLAAGGVADLAGITPDAVARGIATLQRDGYQTEGRGASARKVGLRTAGYMRTACKAFCAWAVDARRLPHNPLAGLRKNRDKAKGRRVESTRPRRALTAEEFARLIDKTEKSRKVWRGLDGRDRAALYLAALHTGFRRSELAGLTPADFRLADDPPTVTTRGYGRAATQRIRPDAAAYFAKYLRGRPADEPVWPGTWTDKAARMLQADLAAAKIPAVVGGRVVDLHALRRTGATLQIAAGADVKSVQAYMRHSTVNLTLDLYTDVLGPNVAAALSALPAVSMGPNMGPRSRRKGTNRSKRMQKARGGRRTA